jgi:hypothetical protein
MKEIPKFEDSHRGDAGRDGGGIYRHIARDTRIPNILTKGDYSTLRWREVCASLYSKPGEDKLKVSMVLCTPHLVCCIKTELFSLPLMLFFVHFP